MYVLSGASHGTGFLCLKTAALLREPSQTRAQYMLTPLQVFGNSKFDDCINLQMASWISQQNKEAMAVYTNRKRGDQGTDGTLATC